MVVRRPQLLRDSGYSCAASDLADYLEEKGMGVVRGAPHYSQNLGKIKRWLQNIKNRFFLENYLLTD